MVFKPCQGVIHVAPACTRNDIIEAGLSAVTTDVQSADWQDGETIPAYQLPAASVLEFLGSDQQNGLSHGEARQRLTRFGPNELESEPPTPVWRRLLAQFEEVLVILLIIAAGVSFGVWVYEGDSSLPYEAMIIFAIVLINGILGYLQEARAERAVAALRATTAATASITRDGMRQTISATELVPGDIILIDEGDAIPADARLLQSTSLQIVEASLTGESFPVSKRVEPIDQDASLGDQSNMVFSGTTASYGRGVAVITATGMRTQIGRIAGLLRQTEVDITPLQAELDRTGKRLGLAVIVIAAVVVTTILFTKEVTGVAAIIDIFVFGVALAVAAVPEGLPAVVTAVLAIGVQRMARRNAIVRKLPAVETLGSATVIASDKTGTLTRNEMTVRVVVTASGQATFSGSGYQPNGEIEIESGSQDDKRTRQEVERALVVFERANNAAVQLHDGQWVALGDPTEAALIVAARNVGLTDEYLSTRFERVHEIPFSSERKRMTTVHRDAESENRLIVFSKGAPDLLLERCAHELRDGETYPLSTQRKLEILQLNANLAREAYRTLGAAFRTLPADTPLDALSDEIEQDLVFVGTAGMIDPPRSEVAAAVERAKQAGIRPIMITGDHPETAVAIAREVGITSEQYAVTGPDISEATDADMNRLVQEHTVFARVDPEHKLRIVQSLKRGGQVVAMTGDGINDAPALRTADIGVAMGITGTDVSKEAADMVLADDNFASIVAAIEEGRAIFDNIQKFLRYLLSSNVGEVLTMFFGVVLAGVLGLESTSGEFVLPLLATHILWINLVTDGPPALALGLDPAQPGLMRRAPLPRGSSVISPQMWAGIIYVGLITAVGTLLVLDAGMHGGLINGSGTLKHARTLAFTTLVLFQLVNVFNARSDVQTAFTALFQNRWLWVSVLLSLVAHVLVIYVPVLQHAFDTEALSLTDWLVCFAVASSVLWLRELGKLVARWRRSAALPSAA